MPLDSLELSLHWRELRFEREIICCRLLELRHSVFEAADGRSRLQKGSHVVDRQLFIHGILQTRDISLERLCDSEQVVLGDDCQRFLATAHTFLGLTRPHLSWVSSDVSASVLNSVRSAFKSFMTACCVSCIASVSCPLMSSSLERLAFSSSCFHPSTAQDQCRSQHMGRPALADITYKCPSFATAAWSSRLCRPSPSQSDPLPCATA